MTKPLHNPRTPEVEVESMFVDRWSPRAFLPDPLSYPELVSLLEAARWSPSCFNEQPWLFVYAVSEEDRDRFASALSKKNRGWASRAPVLLYILARKNFAGNGLPNRHATFDAGAAWMALALQARKLGFYAHCMAGFDSQKAHEILNAPGDRFEVVAAVAIGRRGTPEILPKDLAARESPSMRNPLDKLVAEGGLSTNETD